MGYQNLINKSLKTVFKLCKDLVIDVTVIKNNTNDFDFSNPSLVESQTSIKTQAIIVGKTKHSSSSNTVKQQLILKTIDIVDLNVYEGIQIDKLLWKIGPSINTDGFATIIDVYRET